MDILKHSILDSVANILPMIITITQNLKPVAVTSNVIIETDKVSKLDDDTIEYKYLFYIEE